MCRFISLEGQPAYPAHAIRRLADPTLGSLVLWGEAALWAERRNPLLAFFC